MRNKLITEFFFLNISYIAETDLKFSFFIQTIGKKSSFIGYILGCPGNKLLKKLNV